MKIIINENLIQTGLKDIQYYYYYYYSYSNNAYIFKHTKKYTILTAFFVKRKKKKRKSGKLSEGSDGNSFCGRTGSSLSMGERDFSYKKVIKELTICITVFIQYYTVRSVALQTALWATDRTVGGPGRDLNPGWAI